MKKRLDHGPIGDLCTPSGWTMTKDEILGFLRPTPLLHQVGSGVLHHLAERVRFCEWPRGATILRKGDPGDAMMIVVLGRVKITSVTDSGRETVLNIIEPGESFGEMSLLDGEPRCADAVATEATKAIVLGRKPFQEALAADRTFGIQLIADLCRRLRKTTAIVEDTLFLDPPTRLARRVRNLVQDNGTQRDDGMWVLKGISQQELADAVGLTRESVNKLLNHWQNDGLVSIERRGLVVRDLSQVERLGHIRPTTA